MVTPWKYEKETNSNSKTDPVLLDLTKELIEIVKNNLEGEEPDGIIGKRSAYLEFKSRTRHRIFEFMDMSLNSDEETRKKFLIRGMFVCMMEVGEDGVPLDVSYCIRIQNSRHLVMEETMAENCTLSVESFREVVFDIKNSNRIRKEDYAEYVKKAIEKIVNRRKK